MFKRERSAFSSNAASVSPFESLDRNPVEFVEDGKLTRRTFIKGVGWITVVSTLGGAVAGCAPKADEELEPSESAQAASDATEYSYACCSYIVLRDAY